MILVPARLPERGKMPNTGYASVGLRTDAYKRLLAFAARLQLQRGKRVTMTDAVTTLIDHAENSAPAKQGETANAQP